MKRYIGFLLVLILTLFSICLAEEIVPTKESEKALNARYAEEAVEVWDTNLVKPKMKHSNIVALFLHYKNNTDKTVVGVTVNVVITNPVGKVVFEQTYNDNDIILEPFEKLENDAYWYFPEGDKNYDQLWQIAQNGTAKIKTKILEVVFEDETVLEAKPEP